MDKQFAVTLINEKREIRRTLVVDRYEYILDIADEEGLELPYSCRAGNCFDCLAKVVEGEVEQTAKALEFLKPEELKAGYVLLCASCPGSDCQILTHQAEELFGDE
jgi:ferredoxin